METKKDKKASRPTAKERITELENMVRELEEANAALGNEIESRANELSREWRMKKDRQLSQIEEECEAKIANKDFVIAGLTENVNRAQARVLELETELRKIGRKGFFARIFGGK